jgi:glycosyltransferase involved in cell wall biosynthesis
VPEDKLLMLAFGHIRDDKNLNLVLEAMVSRPEFYLLVAGLELGARQRCAADYQEMAAKLGVADRCRWIIRHIAEHEVGDFFQAADLVLLTYASRFRSASGVLNAAVNFRKPCLASSGKSNLRAVVEKYELGYWVAPDSAAQIADGLLRYLQQQPSARWEDYERENSWEQNAALVIKRMFGPEIESVVTDRECLPCGEGA